LPSAFGDDWAALDSGASRTVYVELLDEGVDVWRPVQADHEGLNFRLSTAAPDGEKWRYPPGSLSQDAVATAPGSTSRQLAS
jgi:hypothetical protein